MPDHAAEFRVATWNMQENPSGNPEKERGLSKLCAENDVVALQECGGLKPEQVAEMLGGAHGTVVDWDSKENRTSGRRCGVADLKERNPQTKYVFVSREQAGHFNNNRCTVGIIARIDRLEDLPGDESAGVNSATGRSAVSVKYGGCVVTSFHAEASQAAISDAHTTLTALGRAFKDQRIIMAGDFNSDLRQHAQNQAVETGLAKQIADGSLMQPLQGGSGRRLVDGKVRSERQVQHKWNVARLDLMSETPLQASGSYETNRMRHHSVGYAMPEEPTHLGSDGTQRHLDDFMFKNMKRPDIPAAREASRHGSDHHPVTLRVR